MTSDLSPSYASAMDKAKVYETLNDAYFSENPHEKAVIQHLESLVRGAKLLVDVGASLGQYTRAMSGAVRGGEILAIEADPLRFEQLQRNCRTWAAESDNTIYARHLALTDHSGQVEYFVTNSDVSGGLTRHVTPRPVEWEKITVSSSTLDDLFPDRAPDFVKIDVEGAELSVLKGATRTLRASTTFLIELHDWPRGSSGEVLALMREAGYRPAPFHGQTIFVKSRWRWSSVVLAESMRNPIRAARFWRWLRTHKH